MNARELREKLAGIGVSQREAARQLDITDRMMRYYCSGEKPVPKAVELALEQINVQRTHNEYEVIYRHDNGRRVGDYNAEVTEIRRYFDGRWIEFRYSGAGVSGDKKEIRGTVYMVPNSGETEFSFDELMGEFSRLLEFHPELSATFDGYIPDRLKDSMPEGYQAWRNKRSQAFADAQLLEDEADRLTAVCLELAKSGDNRVELSRSGKTVSVNGHKSDCRADFFVQACADAGIQ